MKFFNQLKCLFVVALGVFVLNASQAHAYRFVVYGDSRSGAGDPPIFNNTILGAINAQIVALDPKPEFVFFLGDCVRPAVSTDYSHSYLLDWKQFMQQTLGHIPFYVAIGNNDLYGNTGWTEYPLQKLFQSVFTKNPSNGPRHYKKLAYSIEHGKGKERTLFVVLDSFGFQKVFGVQTNFDNGVDEEQLQWLEAKAKNDRVHYKFVLSHGPVFSIEGWPVHSSMKKVWSIMQKNRFHGFYSAHEHIYSRWNITKYVYPPVQHEMFQTIVGSAGAPWDAANLVKVNLLECHINRAYTFIVVDIHPHKMVQRSYALISNGPVYTTQLIDTFTRKN